MEMERDDDERIFAVCISDPCIHAGTKIQEGPTTEKVQPHRGTISRVSKAVILGL